MSRKGVTTIQVYPETRDDLKGILSKDETYDDGLRRLIKMWKKSQGA